MVVDYGTIIGEVVSSKKFGTLDFLEQQRKSLAGECEVVDVLEIYARSLSGEESRKKSSDKKVAKIEALLTPAGLRKLRDCRIDLRMRIELITTESKRQEKMPPVAAEHELPKKPWDCIRAMQEWGSHGEHDPKYYLHMVFRYHMRLLHKACVGESLVLRQPSLQYIVDSLYPSTCSSKFPPEFKRFMDDCSMREVKVVSLPVPRRNNAKEVSYTHNFEVNPAVSAIRRLIQHTIAEWKIEEVYPDYLIKGRSGNDVISEAVVLSTRARERLQKATQLGEEACAVIKKVSKEVPRMVDAHSKYTSFEAKTSGERLKERLGFFLRPSVRSMFIAVKETGLVEEVFELAGRSYDQFHVFDLYCTANSPLEFIDKDNGEGDCRNLLILVESVVSLVATYHERDVDTRDPSQIVRDAIRKIENSV